MNRSTVWMLNCQEKAELRLSWSIDTNQTALISTNVDRPRRSFEHDPRSSERENGMSHYVRKKIGVCKKTFSIYVLVSN